MGRGHRPYCCSLTEGCFGFVQRNGDITKDLRDAVSILCNILCNQSEDVYLHKLGNNDLSHEPWGLFS
jgi:hypothetical protein